MFVYYRRAKAFIDDIVSRGHDMSNGQSGSMQEMIIPAGKAGLIIGKGGETIKQLQVRHSGHFYYDFNKQIGRQFFSEETQLTFKRRG